ncbi:MAG: GTPase Era, partial [Sphingomonadales bacterium]
VDATRGVDGDTRRIVDGLKSQNRKAVLVLNKVDAMRKEKLLELASTLDREGVFTDIFMVSALVGDGIAEFLAHLARAVPKGPWHYPADQVSDISDRMLAAEITREKLYLRLHQELPYASAVETERWQEQKDGSVRIEQTIFVERPTQKAIVIGKKGQTLKEIGQAARVEMEELLECRVHLFLFVKVRERWSEEREHYRNIGLDFTE